MTQRAGSTDRIRIYHFRIDQLLGRGGTGTVYRGIDSNTGAVVALKLFHANFFRNRLHIRDLAKSTQRFKKFSHPNVVRIYDFISGEEGEVLVEEYVDGPDLKWYMTERPWNLPERLVIAAQICNGLQYIHEHGFIHHDLKPGNVLFTRKGMVKLTDYSLVRQSVLNMFGAGLSEQVTPMYVAPELILKQKATAKSDIYSLGITFYQLFTERLPFFETKVDNLQKLYYCHVHVTPIHPSQANPKCPPVLGDIIMKMIDKKPENRFENADLLRITLAEIGRSRI
jgi:serine/threonine-protein kinase